MKTPGIQRIIAEHAEITPSALSQILSGKRKPSWPLAKRLAVATMTKPELWLEGTPEAIKEAVEWQSKKIISKHYKD